MKDMVELRNSQNAVTNCSAMATKSPNLRVPSRLNVARSTCISISVVVLMPVMFLLLNHFLENMSLHTDHKLRGHLSTGSLSERPMRATWNIHCMLTAMILELTSVRRTDTL